jgi:hypothetical protein
MALPSSAIAAISVDGQLHDWMQHERLDLVSGATVNGYELYGRYEDKSYKFALHRIQGDIKAGTTIWLNTDQNVDTGYQIFGSTGGAEFNVNFHTDDKPYLYSGAAAENFVAGALEHIIVSDGQGGSIVELVIPEAQLASPTASSINLVLDINNNVFLPSSYNDNNQYVLNKESLPTQAKQGKRVGIVYSETSKNRFWGEKAYSQLFMSVQTQVMMSGVPYDLLNESDLTDLNKIVNYDSLIFPYMPAVADASYAKIKQNLALAVQNYNIGIITAGNFLTNKENGDSLAGDAYLSMKNLLGVTRIDGAGPVNIEVNTSNNTHPVLAEYKAGESIQKYEQNYTDYFIPAAGSNATVLAEQIINGTEKHEAVIATKTGGRNVHFATVQQMTDANMLWSAVQWSSLGDDPVVSLKMGRQDSIFVSRNDMDQSMFVEEINTVEVPLLGLLQEWKTKYDFVGSYYINVGNDPTGGEYTNWDISGPLYQQYIALGNEIGTHSYTHPHDTNGLSDAEIKFEFADARTNIEQGLNLNNLSAAVPGAPEDLRTALEISKHVSYLSGGYSGVGAGFNNAMGFLTPESTKVYLSPNVTFDFTNMGFLGYTAEQTKQIWLNELSELNLHANQAIIHWPWHDYGPTTSVVNEGYTVDMFDAVIKKAHTELGAEFITGMDLAERMVDFKQSELQITRLGSKVDVQVSKANFGKQSLKLDNDYKIKSVNNWYAYNDQYVYLDKDGGNFSINLGTIPDIVTHITHLPARAELLSVQGDGKNISFSFKGAGKVNIELACSAATATVQGANNTTVTGSMLELNFTTVGDHAASVNCAS